jgi:hypothetical protein
MLVTAINSLQFQDINSFQDFVAHAEKGRGLVNKVFVNSSISSLKQKEARKLGLAVIGFEQGQAAPTGDILGAFLHLGSPAPTGMQRDLNFGEV